MNPNQPEPAEQPEINQPKPVMDIVTSRQQPSLRPQPVAATTPQPPAVTNSNASDDSAQPQMVEAPKEQQEEQPNSAEIAPEQVESEKTSTDAKVEADAKPVSKPATKKSHGPVLVVGSAIFVSAAIAVVAILAYQGYPVADTALPSSTITEPAAAADEADPVDDALQQAETPIDDLDSVAPEDTDELSDQSLEL